MRSILHNFQDEQCIRILENIIDVMAPDSRILIDDMVLPDTGVHWQATFVDITMMVGLAAVERTTSQWETLLDSAGLKILDIKTYTEALHESVIVAALKQPGEIELVSSVGWNVRPWSLYCSQDEKCKDRG